ncbi:hypothetical protein NC652_033301 [Populus alba x Populus x berolinensis]|nr:hypothetical protein NC652_033301 [Populus alba x Populus x berolinensis]
MATSSIASNTELSRVVAVSIRPSSNKPLVTQQSIGRYSFSRFSNRFPLLSVRATSNSSMSKENSSKSGDGAGGRLTYKDAGVIQMLGLSLLGELQRWLLELVDLVVFSLLFSHTGDSYLVAGTDGVGTKLKLAFETGIHETIGIDLVIKGMVGGCQQSDCTLLGGEVIAAMLPCMVAITNDGVAGFGLELSQTAEMPDFYAKGEYDLSGFAVGIVKKDSVIDGKNIVAGDVLIGLPSSGVHSNGFSLIRSGLSLNDQLPGGSVSLVEALMAPTVIYVKQVLDLISKGGVKGIARITGGGFTDNMPRVFPKGPGASIYKESWEVPTLFIWIQEAGRIEDAEMIRTFNMGIGMVLVVTEEASHKILEEGQHKAYRIGEVVCGEGVRYC